MLDDFGEALPTKRGEGTPLALRKTEHIGLRGSGYDGLLFDQTSCISRTSTPLGCLHYRTQLLWQPEVGATLASIVTGLREWALVSLKIS